MTDDNEQVLTEQLRKVRDEIQERGWSEQRSNWLEVINKVLDRLDTSYSASEWIYKNHQWSDGEAGPCNVVQFNGEDVKAITQIADSKERAKLIMLHNRAVHSTIVSVIDYLDGVGPSMTEVGLQ